MQSTILKIYGYLQPCAEDDLAALESALRLLGEAAPEVLRLDGDLLNISYEGVFFPIEDFLEALLPLLDTGIHGKIDYIDMEEWTLTRYSFENGFITSSKRGLNDVLDFSGH